MTVTIGSEKIAARTISRLRVGLSHHHINRLLCEVIVVHDFEQKEVKFLMLIRTNENRIYCSALANSLRLIEQILNTSGFLSDFIVTSPSSAIRTEL